MPTNTTDARLGVQHQAHTSISHNAQMESVESTLRELLQSVLRKGYFGSAGIHFVIQDGIIQNIRSQTERMKKCGNKCE